MKTTSRRLKIALRNRPWLWVRVFTTTNDFFAIILAWIGAFWLRFNFYIPEASWNTAINSLYVIIPTQLTIFFLFRLDRIIARFASIPDLLRIIKATMAAVSACAVLLFIWNRLYGVPRSIFALDLLLLIFFLGGSRLAWRLYKDGLLHKKTGLRTLIIGAGKAGEQLVRDILRQTDQTYQPIGFLDDDRRKTGQRVLGVPVLGRTRELPRLVKKLDIEMILLAIPSANRRTIKRFVDLCKEAEVQYRTLPSLHDLISGQVNAEALREVTIEDLLGRAPVKLDWYNIKTEMNDKAILISGAGGSIGGELCRQIARLGPRSLILFDASEYGLYEVERCLKDKFPNLNLQVILGDIKDKVKVEGIFREQRPQIVFHAAAYKHVPMVEQNPVAGVETNIIGTKIIADAASAFKVSKFIMISTDKAVNPTSIMGATKRVAEIYCQNLNYRSQTAFITTRFGNVLGSSGSVVPLFKKQVAKGGPVTVTHPEIERYFMTIAEACQLVLQAATMGKGGEIFVLEMGEPIKIRELAEQIIRLSGLEPEKDIPIIYTGLRPGEKLYEELFHPSERLRSTTHPKILLARSRKVNWKWLQTEISRLKKTCIQGQEKREIQRILSNIVPEYISDQASKIIPLKSAQQAGVRNK